MIWQETCPRSSGRAAGQSSLLNQALYCPYPLLDIVVFSGPVVRQHRRKEFPAGAAMMAFGSDPEDFQSRYAPGRHRGERAYARYTAVNNQQIERPNMLQEQMRLFHRVGREQPNLKAFQPNCQREQERDIDIVHR